MQGLEEVSKIFRQPQWTEMTHACPYSSSGNNADGEGHTPILDSEDENMAFFHCTCLNMAAEHHSSAG